MNTSSICFRKGFQEMKLSSASITDIKINVTHNSNLRSNGCHITNHFVYNVIGYYLFLIDVYEMYCLMWNKFISVCPECELLESFSATCSGPHKYLLYMIFTFGDYHSITLLKNFQIFNSRINSFSTNLYTIVLRFVTVILFSYL